MEFTEVKTLKLTNLPEGVGLAFDIQKCSKFQKLNMVVFLTKWPPFVWISNGWVSGFQIPFKIQTI